MTNFEKIITAAPSLAVYSEEMAISPTGINVDTGKISKYFGRDANDEIDEIPDSKRD